MSGSIFIEASEAGSFGVPLGAVHLYLVWREAGTGAEYVIRSGPESPWRPFGGEMRIEANVPIGESADDRGGETPAERSSTPLDFPVTDDAAWSIMVKYCRALDAADYGYHALQENSNAFVLALVRAAGGDPATMLPRGVRPSEVIGYDYWDDIVADVAPPTDRIFRGSAGNDRLVGLQMDEFFALFSGNDVLRAGRGNDVVYCGTGNDLAFGEDGSDTMHGGDGADRLVGGRGADLLHGEAGADTLFGGAGADVLSGGSGSDRLRGGSGADVFEFTGGGTDVVDDFRDGLDRLRINAAGVDSFADLSVRSVGDDLRVDFDGGAVLLRDLERADFGAADVSFVLQDILTA